MGRFEIDRRGAIVVKRAFLARNTHAPFIAGRQSGKTPLRVWRDQVIAVQHGEIQKLLRNFHANGMLTHILWPCATETITIKASHWVATTTFQFCSQNVCRHKNQFERRTLTIGNINIKAMRPCVAFRPAMC